jgi:hypothetical protein
MLVTFAARCLYSSCQTHPRSFGLSMRTRTSAGTEARRRKHKSAERFQPEQKMYPLTRITLNVFDIMHESSPAAIVRDSFVKAPTC